MGIHYLRTPELVLFVIVTFILAGLARWAVSYMERQSDARRAHAARA